MDVMRKRTSESEEENQQREWVLEAEAGGSVKSQGYLSAFSSGEQSEGKAEALMFCVAYLYDSFSGIAG